MRVIAIMVSCLAAVFVPSVAALSAAGAGGEAAAIDGFEPRTHKAAAGGTMPYRLRKPEGYDAKTKYPLVLLLHGAGERGTDNQSQLKWGGSLLGKEIQPKHPCFVVAPQCPPEKQWVNTPWGEGSYSTETVAESDELKLAIDIVKSVMKEFEGSVDPDRVYVTGLSMGGYGSWDAAVRHPDLFAAAVPICGAGDPAKAKAMKDVKVWAFHGSADNVVPPRGSREMVGALVGVGAQPKYTEYEGVDHGSWVNAWQEKELFDWMFAQKRETGTK